MLDFIRKHGMALDLSGALLFLALAFFSLMAGQIYLFFGFMAGVVAFCSSMVCSIRRENGADATTAFVMTVLFGGLALAVFIVELFA